MSVEQELAEIVELEKLAATSSPLASWAAQEAITKRAKLQLDPAEVQYRPDNVWTPQVAKRARGSEGQGPSLVGDAYNTSGGQPGGKAKSPRPKGTKQCPLCSGAGHIPKKNKGPKLPNEAAVTGTADSKVAVDDEAFR